MLLQNLKVQKVLLLHADDSYVPIFAIGRAPGWVIQCVEQLETNILIRPLTLYNGPEPRAYVPMADR